MEKNSFSVRLSGIIGNILEHYDHALFSLLAPFIAPLFFPAQDPITALILTYGMLPIGILGRPLGSLFFGWMGDRHGRRKALFWSLLGMACVTVGIGCLPVYAQIGVWAPMILAFSRLLQSFFAGGETVGGAIFVLENTEGQTRGFMSSLYDASTIGGILIASGLVTWFSYLGTIDQMWRVLFWIGGMAAVFGLILRLKKDEEGPSGLATSLFSGIRGNLKEFISIIFASGFSYTTYALPFVLMNSYVPLVTEISKSEVMTVNTALLVVDMFLLPCFGYLATRLGKERVMFFGAFCSALSSIPLFYLLGPSSSFGLVVFVRLAIVFFGVAFAAPYHAWAMEQVPKEARYSVLSVGHSLGTQLIGVPATAICLFLYKQIGWSCAPGFYLLVVGLAASYVVRASMKTARLKSAPLL